MFGHKCEYKNQIDLFKPPLVINSTMFGNGYYGGEVDSNGDPIEINKEVRICKRCKRKEQKSIGFDRNLINVFQDTLSISKTLINRSETHKHFTSEIIGPYLSEFENQITKR
jgi:hypothetical protein